MAVVKCGFRWRGGRISGFVPGGTGAEAGEYQLWREFSGERQIGDCCRGKGSDGVRIMCNFFPDDFL